MVQVVRHKLGVYLNEAHEDYLEDCGFGYSQMKVAAKAPVEAWWMSKWNDLRPEEKTKPAFERGDALHKDWLYGREVYERSCIVKPDTYEDAKTGEIKKWNGNANVCKEWLEKHDRPGVNIITREDDIAIRLAHKMAFINPQAMEIEGEKVSLSDAFTGTGLNEVSVYWDEGEIPCRARLDRMKPNLSLDLKSITDWKKGDFKQSLLREIVIRGYLIQAVHYDRAREELRRAVEEGRVYGASELQMQTLQEIAAADNWAWANVFAKLDGAPQVRCILIDREGPQYMRARQTWEQALTMIEYFRSFYGWDQMWRDGELIWAPDATDWPSWSVED